jgi:glyoxylase-like metal-dependent hydrolase (beta-lactamase superfamily II)
MDMSEIRHGEIYPLGERIRRVTAPNPGVMTGPGTNAYIVGTGALALIDPGPAIESHIEAMLAAVGNRLRWILCTHAHHDHSPAAQAVKAATGAQLIGMPPPPGERHDQKFAPDWRIRDGERLEGDGFTLRAVHTPGHASNHMCYLLEEERLLFTGDHVMQGSTVVIGPPDGSMSAYLQSLDKLLGIDIARFAPGHGHPIDTPHDEVRKLIRHRLGREQKVMTALQKVKRGNLDVLVPHAYDDVSEKLHPIAKRSLFAHLEKLEVDGKVKRDGEDWMLCE